MVSHENQVLIASTAVALSVIVLLRTFTNLGTVPRFAVVIVAILVTQSVLGRASE